jgi:chromosome segregation ATPase
MQFCNLILSPRKATMGQSSSRPLETNNVTQEGPGREAPGQDAPLLKESIKHLESIIDTNIRLAVEKDALIEKTELLDRELAEKRQQLRELNKKLEANSVIIQGVENEKAMLRNNIQDLETTIAKKMETINNLRKCLKRKEVRHLLSIVVKQLRGEPRDC